MAPPKKQDEEEVDEATLLSTSQEAEDELDEAEVLASSQEAEAELDKAGTAENPAQPSGTYEPMSPEEQARLNPPWDGVSGPGARKPTRWDKFTTDPELIAKLDEASAGGPVAAIRGFNDWILNSNADEVLGRIGSTFPRLSMPISEALDPRIPTPMRTYEEVRDEQRAANKFSEENSPLSYYAGGLASVLAAGAAGRGLATAGVPQFTGLSGRALQGGISGATSALGASEADLVRPTTDDLTQASVETGAGGVLGAAIGAAAPPVAQAIARRVPGLAGRFRGWLEEQAERRAVKAVTGQNQKAITSMIDKDSLQRAGRHLLDEGVVTPMASTATMRQRASDLMGAAGEQAGTALRNLDEAIPEGNELMPREVAGRAFTDIVQPLQASTAGMQDVATRVNRDVRAFLDRGARTVLDDDGVERLVFDRPISLEEANRFKSALDDHINWGTPEPTPVVEQLRRLRGLLNEQIESKAAQAAGASPAAAQSFEDFIGAKDLYGSMADVAIPGLRQEARELSNRIASPSDYGAGGVGALLASLASGGDLSTTALFGAGALGANKLGRAYGNQLSATAMDAVSRPGGRLDRLAGTAAEEISPFIQGALTTTPQMAGRAVAGAESLVDFSNGPDARSKTPAGRAIYNAVRANPQAFGKYANRLLQASENGEAALALQDYILGNSDPEYAQMRKRALGVEE